MAPLFFEKWKRRGYLTKIAVRQVIVSIRIHKTVFVETLLSKSLGVSFFLPILKDFLYFHFVGKR
tara:strand:- start:832 stop:1026 length:195 start_codon:yes stop_codon:yes gene_type:complete